MLINQDLAAFMASPVMIILGTCDESLSPDIARAVGTIVRREEGSVDLMVSRWQWPQTVANIGATGRLAVTFARPSDYVSYQIKGNARAVPKTAQHADQVKRYIRAVTSTLGELGLEPRIVAPWLVDRDLVVLRLSVQEIFVQTPGAKAGQLLERLP